MIAKLLLGSVIAAAAITTGAPTLAALDNPFGHLWMDGQCSAPAPVVVCHSDVSQVRAGIQDGLNDMQSGRSAPGTS